MGTGGNITGDAHLGALAIEVGSRIFSTDREFARFRGLKWRNPVDGTLSQRQKCLQPPHCILQYRHFSRIADAERSLPACAKCDAGGQAHFCFKQ